MPCPPGPPCGGAVGTSHEYYVFHICKVRIFHLQVSFARLYNLSECVCLGGHLYIIYFYGFSTQEYLVDFGMSLLLTKPAFYFLLSECNMRPSITELGNTLNLNNKNVRLANNILPNSSFGHKDTLLTV